MKVVVESFLSEPVGEFHLSREPVTIGRDDGCAVRLGSPYVSRRHAVIEPCDDGHQVRPLGSNGTYVNKALLPEGSVHRLRPGDVIGIGGFLLSVVEPGRDRVVDDAELLLQKRYSDLKAQLHDELIDRLDLRALSGAQADEEHRRERFDAAFRELISQPMELDDELEDFVLREAVRMGLLDRLVLAREKGLPGGSDRRSNSYARPTDERGQSFKRFLAACGRDLGLGHDAGFDRSAVQAILERTPEVWRSRGPELSDDVRRWVIARQIRRDLEDLVFGLGPLEDLIRTPNINEVMVVSNDRIYVEKDGEVEETGRAFPREDDVEVAIARILAPAGRTVNRAQPIVDARLADGSRVTVVVPPIALRGPAITIRKFRPEPFTIEDLISFGSFNERGFTLLRACVRSAKNIVISGGTGSGKTTLLNTLSSQIPVGERIVTIEDSAELQMQQPHVVQLEARKANMEGVGAIPIRELVRAALRMRPDRIVVGECRGAEALDMLQAMNTGHDGSMTTAHANSPTDMISRLEVMVLEAGQNLPVQAIQRQIAGAVDVIVQIERQRDKVRRVTRITEVVEFDPEEQRLVLEDVLRLGPGPDGRPELKFTGYLPTFIEDMMRTGDLRLEELF